MTPRERRAYDHRIKSRVVATGNPSLFPQLAIPRSTAKSWIRRGEREVVSLEYTVETGSQHGAFDGQTPDEMYFDREA
jgi:hypothetical protein